MANRIEIGVERVEGIDKAELWTLFESHAGELTTNKALMKLAPDIEKFYMLERAGFFFFVVARCAGSIVGYSGNFVGHHLHFSGLCYCHNDSLFLAKPYRRGTLGLKLMRETEREAKARNAQLVVWQAKQGSTLDRLLARLGYQVQDVMYSRGI